MTFPGYVGKNLNAIDEAITDLEWFPANGYAIVFENAEHLVADESLDVLAGILEVFQRAGQEWSSSIREGQEWDRDAKPFHTIFEFSPLKANTFLELWNKTGVPIHPLTFAE